MHGARRNNLVPRLRNAKRSPGPSLFHALWFVWDARRPSFLTALTCLQGPDIRPLRLFWAQFRLLYLLGRPRSLCSDLRPLIILLNKAPRLLWYRFYKTRR